MTMKLYTFITSLVILITYSIPGNCNIVQTWGSEVNDRPKGLVVDSDGFIYLLDDRSDHDIPRAGEEYFTTTDMYLTKFDSEGNLIWVLNWNYSEFNIVSGHGIDIDQNNCIYISGNIIGSMDMDPGIGTEIISIPDKGTKGFLLKLDNDGNFMWCNVFNERIEYICCDLSNNIYLAGKWYGYENEEGVHIDYTGSFYSYINKIHGTYIAKYDQTGNEIWAHHLGGESQYIGPLDNPGMHIGANWIGIDGYSNIIVMGAFEGTEDFDPGDGVYQLTANQEAFRSIFLAFYDTNGDFISAQSMTYEPTHSVIGPVVSISREGQIIYSNAFRGSFELNTINGPTTMQGLDDSTSMFVCKYDDNFEIEWVKSWISNESRGMIKARDIDFDDNGRIYIGAEWRGLIDLNPDDGEENINTNGDNWQVIICLGREGNYLWSKYWECDDAIDLMYVEVRNNLLYVNGAFKETINIEMNEEEIKHVAIGEYDCYLVIMPIS